MIDSANSDSEDDRESEYHDKIGMTDKWLNLQLTSNVSINCSGDTKVINDVC